jgi:hypothetical protein
MAGATRKLGLEIDSQLYSSLDQLARDNGQTRRFLLEDALRFYLGGCCPFACYSPTGGYGAVSQVGG